METLGGRKVVEGKMARSSGKRDMDLIYKDLTGGDDGDSQEHGLETGGAEVDSWRGIRRVTKVMVTGSARNSDEGGYEQQPLPQSELALGRSAWRKDRWRHPQLCKTQNVIIRLGQTLG